VSALVLDGQWTDYRVLAEGWKKGTTMLTREENELLTRVGRNTPMGKFMRQFWIPACLSSELEADGPQMRMAQ